MPILTAFHGIVIRMYYRNHEPQHFHAEHQGDHATFTFDGQLHSGVIRSRRARALIETWAALHRHELQSNWGRAGQGLPLEHIAPLE